MEMVLTLPVGPESHINCMHESCVSVSLGWLVLNRDRHSMHRPEGLQAKKPVQNP